MKQFNLFVLAFIAYLACSNPGRSAEIDEMQGRWTLATISGLPSVSLPPVHFEIKGTQIIGFDGCNSFAGSLDKPDAIIATQRGCPTGNPFDVSDLVRDLRLATVVSGRLTVTSGLAGRKLEFSKEER